MEKNKKTKTTFELKRLPKNAFEILANIPWDEISAIREKVIDEVGKSIEIKGFRKGNAPKNMVVETIGAKKLLELVLENLVPDLFRKAISELNLRPIVTPKTELVSAKENEDWQLKFTSCEEPEINLGNYKEELAKLKTPQIWTPGKGEKEKKPEKTEEKEEKIDKAITYLSEKIKIEICDLLIEEEVGRRLSNLLEQTQKLGITIDQYLSSIGKTVAQIKAEYHSSAEKNLAFEFILNKIADLEKIEVKPEEIDKLIETAQNEDDRKSLESQKYLLASLLRRQKTLDFLANLV